MEDNKENKIYLLYHVLLTKYVKKIFPIEKFDNYFNNSNLRYVKIEKDNMDKYQLMSSSEFNYFYIRNDLYLNNLDENELNFIRKKVKDNDNNLDDKTEEFIKKTYKKVIQKDKDKPYNKFYVPFNSNYLERSDKLILGFRYDEFNSDGLTDDEWDELHEQQINDKFQALMELTLEMNKINNDEVKILEFNDFNTYKNDRRK